MQRSYGDDVHLSAKQIFEVLLQGDMIDKASPLLHVNEEIKVAAGLLLPAGSRSKEPQVLCTMLASQAKNVVPVFSDGRMHSGSLR